MPGFQAAVHDTEVAGEDRPAGQGVRGTADQEGGVRMGDEAGLEVDAALGSISRRSVKS